MNAAGEVLHLRGRVIIDDDTEKSEVWVVGGRLTFERPRFSGTPTLIEGDVIPGLVDMHCHVGTAPGGEAEPEMALKQAEVDRDTGVLLIRDAGSATDTSWIHQHDELPRLIRSGRFIARPMRYLKGFAREVEPPSALPAVVAEQARHGDGWVKIIADWIDRDLGADGDLRPLWTDDVLKEAIAGAHALGVRVTAHTFMTEAVDGLLDAGIDCIEHGTGMTHAQMERAAVAGVPVVPTLLQVSHFASMAAQGRDKYPLFAARMQSMYERREQQVRDFRDAGIQMFVGTDAGGTIAHGSFPDELRLMVAAGVPAAEVVAAASWRARAFLGVPGIEEGASADVVVYAGDPRQHIDEIGYPRAIVLRGAQLASMGDRRHGWIPAQ